MNEFITLTTIGILVIVSPGPDFAITTKSSLIDGRTAGLMSAVGIAFANLCHVIINLLGIGVIISQSLLIFSILKILGAAYLLYLGFTGLSTKPLSSNGDLDNHLIKNTLSPSSKSISKKAKKGFLNGLLTSLLNPKAWLFYLSLFSVILSTQTPISSKILYGLWLSFMVLVWFMLVAIFFTNPIFGKKLNQYKHWIERFTGGVFILLGFQLLVSEFSS